MHEFYFEKLENPLGTSEKLITYVKDRPGYDLRMDEESKEGEYQNYYEEQYK